MSGNQSRTSTIWKALVQQDECLFWKSLDCKPLLKYSTAMTEMNPVAITIINRRKENWPSWESNQRPPQGVQSHRNVHESRRFTKNHVPIYVPNAPERTKSIY